MKALSLEINEFYALVLDFLKSRLKRTLSVDESSWRDCSSRCEVDVGQFDLSLYS